MTRAMCAQADQALCIGPAAPGQSYLNQAAILFAAEAQRRAGHPSGLWLPVGERGLRRTRRAGRADLHRPERRLHPHHGRQGRGQARDAARPACPACPGRTTALPDDPAAIRALAREIGYPVIVKAAGGGGGRGMRVVHERGRAARRAGADARRSAPRLRQPRGLHREVPAASAPCRDPGAGRQPRQCAVARQPRLLAAAPPPESARRSAGAGHRRRADRRGRASAAPRPAGRSATAASAPSSSSTRTARSTSSR